MGGRGGGRVRRGRALALMRSWSLASCGVEPSPALRSTGPGPTVPGPTVPADTPEELAPHHPVRRGRSGDRRPAERCRARRSSRPPSHLVTCDGTFAWGYSPDRSIRYDLFALRGTDHYGARRAGRSPVMLGPLNGDSTLVRFRNIEERDGHVIGTYDEWFDEATTACASCPRAARSRARRGRLRREPPGTIAQAAGLTSTPCGGPPCGGGRRRRPCGNLRRTEGRAGLTHRLPGLRPWRPRR